MEFRKQLKILPPPPAEIPMNVHPIKIVPPEKSSVMEIVKPKAAPAISHLPGLKGKRVCLLTNLFKVTIARALDDFYHYDISIFYEDGGEVCGKNVKRAVVEELSEVYKQELAGKMLVYDGVGSIFTLGPLQQNNLELSVVINREGISSGSSLGGNGSPNGNDQKRQKLSPCSKMFRVQMSFVSQISMKSFSERSLRVLNIILQQQACRKGCLVVGQSFFLHEQSNYVDLGGGILGCRGFFLSFRALQGGLFLIHDLSMTTTIQPGAVVDFLMSNQNACGTLKNLRIRVKHLNREFRITGLSERSCKEQKFSFKLRGVSYCNGVTPTIQTTVFDYFVSTRNIALSYSGNLPCINIGKPNRAVFFPVELCYLVPLQRNKNELNVYQRTAMVTKSSQKPDELLKVLTDGSKRIKHEIEVDPLLKSCGISINSSLIQAEGRVLSPPQLKMGNAEHIVPRNGWWNIKDKKLLEPKKLENWVIVNFSTSCDVRKMFEEFFKIGSAKGMIMSPPSCVLDENPKNRKKPASVRVDMMFQQLQSRCKQHPPKFIICLLADKKFSDLYGPWKRKTLIEFGILNQCLSSSKIDELYLINVLLKINMKLGGLNHAIVSDLTRSISFVSKIPTMIFGIQVSHASPGRADAPSIASVVGSREWPRISSYRASVRAIPPKFQMIDSLFKPMSEQKDAGIIRELLMEFYTSSGKRKPAQIIIFRNGLSTSQFNEFLNVEMDLIHKACNFLEANWRPKFTVIVSQRRHHTKFFEAGAGANVPPGTIVDSKVCDLQYTNFYMCAHSARIGTSRSTHYQVLLDEIGFSSDDLQELIHSLSYIFQRSNRAISEVAPIRYARLAAAQILQIIKPEEMMKTSQGMDEINMNVGDNLEALVIIDDYDSETIPIRAQYGGGTVSFSGCLIGIQRETFDEMYELYCKHAREVGFGVRKRVKKKGKISESSNEDEISFRQNNITRTDCKAFLRVKRNDEGMLEVIDHNEEHNHELSRKKWSHMHRSHRKITEDKAVVIGDMIFSGLGPTNSYRYMSKEAGGDHLVGHTLKDHMNFVNRMRMSVIEAGDAQTLIDRLCQEGVEDGDFFYRFKLNGDGRLSDVFWRDSMMCEDFLLYGDVVVFDTTYRTNKYGLICAPFVGLNHHKKNVMFGCAFILDEKTETFMWLFEFFKKSMKMKCPVTIFTDQDLAITSALSKRSESTNSAIGFKASKAKNLNEFYTIFKQTVQRWRSKEEVDEFECSRAIPDSRLPLVRMVMHASEVYTLLVFRDFEDEFLKSISSIVETVGEELEVRVYDVHNHDERTAHRVNFYSGDNYISCTCRRFEEYGLLCSHCLRILDRHSVKEIPGSYILKRWTKLTKKDLWDKADSAPHTNTDLLHSAAWRDTMARNYYTILLRAQANEEARRIVEDGFKSILDGVQALTTTTNLIEDTDVFSSSVSVLDPAKAKTKGRKKRIKGQFEKGRKKKKSAEGSSNKLSEFGSKTPNPRLF
ncbi:hypothetical protein C2S51_000305 [Perilla frutescens var. frutescens]|nr:hypothetical protein C2S51_000305 [Perilla frutescens var. frutescens]